MRSTVNEHTSDTFLAFQANWQTRICIAGMCIFYPWNLPTQKWVFNFLFDSGNKIEYNKYKSENVPLYLFDIFSSIILISLRVCKILLLVIFSLVYNVLYEIVNLFLFLHLFFIHFYCSDKSYKASDKDLFAIYLQRTIEFYTFLISIIKKRANSKRNINI